VCGVVAIWAPGGGVTAGEVTAPLRALRHRGPDGSRSWVSPTGRVALGHTRLAIIDLDTGDQPIGTADERYQLVCNGEFYGYEAIRAELARAGRQLRTRTDVEIALHLYAAHGPRALDRLRGEFAFAIWDERRGQLFAARDRFGVKPLFYAEHGGRLYLASEVKALLAAGVPARWDVPAFADHLLLACPPDRTLFAGIRQVPPGGYLLAGPRGLRLGRYWDLEFPPAAELPVAVAESELAGHRAVVADALADAVRVRTRADVPVGYHLSGGVDSSSVVALASADAAGPLHTFTVRFDDPELDESAVAARTAARFGARSSEILVGRAEYARRIDEAVTAGELIQENSHGIARLVQSEAISAHGYKVVLAGEGGDEVFAGYPQLQRDLAFTLSAEVRDRTLAGYARLDRQPPGLPRHLRLFRDRLGFVPSWAVDRYLHVTLPLLPLLREEFGRRLADREPGADLLDAPALAGRSPFHRSTYLFAKTWLCTYLLAAERLDMAHALEVRLPFLDHHLVDVVARTPLAGFAGSGSTATKALLREAMRDRLPDEVYRAPKRGFFAPPAVSDPAALARLREIVAGDALDRLPFFDPVAVRAAFDRIAAEPAGQRGRHERLVQIVAGAALLTETFGMSCDVSVEAA